MTRVFVQRVFEECMAYEKEMDYKTYLDFVLAMDNKREPQALQYFFRLLDVNHHNYLNTFDLHYYFKVRTGKLCSYALSMVFKLKFL